MSERHRLNTRFPYRQAVWLKSDGHAEFVALRARDITAEGIFLLGETPPPELQWCVELRLEDPSGAFVTVRARVVRIVSGRSARSPNQPAGMGLRFEDLDEAQRGTIQAIVELARGADSRPRVPRIVPHAQRPLTDPMLEYVLNHVDGQRSPEVIAQEIGLELDVVAEMIHGLQQKGVVELAAPASIAPLAIKDASSNRPALDRLSSRASSAAGKSERTDLDAASQKAIEAFYARIGNEGHYAVLGVPKSARPDEILRAFVALAHSFGPEAYAGRELGPFLAKLETILQRIGDAYAALSNDRLRREYDAYLARAETIATWETNKAENTASPERMAREHEAAARYEERHQDWEKAARSWTRVYETRPDDASCARHAGRALIEAKRELRRAQAFVERAVLLDPENPLNHRLLARIFVESGLRRRARQQLQLASKLEQAHREAATR